eukprot:scaffold183433_cov43-Prasinocladus_malaysianus.AAC.2
MQALCRTFCHDDTMTPRLIEHRVCGTWVTHNPVLMADKFCSKQCQPGSTEMPIRLDLNIFPSGVGLTETAGTSWRSIPLASLICRCC